MHNNNRTPPKETKKLLFQLNSFKLTQFFKDTYFLPKDAHT